MLLMDEVRLTCWPFTDTLTSEAPGAIILNLTVADSAACSRAVEMKTNDTKSFIFCYAKEIRKKDSINKWDFICLREINRSFALERGV